MGSIYVGFEMQDYKRYPFYIFPVAIGFVDSCLDSVIECKMGSASKPFPPGVHVPTLTFFHGNPRQDIDWDTQRAHLEYLIKSGVHGGMYLPTSLVVLR